MYLKKTLVSATAVLATVVVAGCGSAQDISAMQAGAQSGATLTKANFGTAMAAATSQARSVHVTGHITVQGQSVTIAADLAKSGVSATDAAVAATISIGGMGTVQVRVVGGALYVDSATLPFLKGSAGKPWVKFPLGDRSNPLGALVGHLTDGLRPAGLAQVFRSVSTFTKVGPANIDGVQSTHYKVTVDLAKAASVLGLPQRPGMSGVPKTATYDVWLDASSRPVMVSANNPQFTMNLQFSQWGVPVHVVAPPASQVGTFSH